jgi:hypothetical protein
MGMAAWGADVTMAARLPSHAIPVLALRVVGAVAVALVALDLTARLVRADDFNEARALVLARLRRLRRPV